MLKSSGALISLIVEDSVFLSHISMYVCMYVWWLSYNTWYCLVINREPVVNTTTKLTIYFMNRPKCP